MGPQLYMLAILAILVTAMAMPLLYTSQMHVEPPDNIGAAFPGEKDVGTNNTPVSSTAEYTIIDTTRPGNGTGPGSGARYPPPLYVWYREDRAEYIDEYPLSGIPDEAVDRGEGRRYLPPELVTYMGTEVEYIGQWLLYPEEPSAPVGNGTGPWYPPIPPITHLSRGPEYLIQWVLPSGPGYGFPIHVYLSLNATRVYVDQPVHVSIRVVSPVLSGNPSGLDAYLYMVRRGISGSSLRRLRVVDGWANTTIRPAEAGVYTVYVVVPRATIYSGARSGNATLLVEKYPATLHIVAPRYVFRDEPLRVRVYADNNVTGREISGVTVTVYATGTAGTAAASATLTGGEATAVFTSLPPGTYTVYAVLNETRLYSQARSNTVSVRVLSVTRELGGTGISLTTPSTYIVVAAAILLLYITIRRYRT